MLGRPSIPPQAMHIIPSQQAGRAHAAPTGCGLSLSCMRLPRPLALSHFPPPIVPILNSTYPPVKMRPVSEMAMQATMSVWQTS